MPDRPVAAARGPRKRLIRDGGRDAGVLEMINPAERLRAYLRTLRLLIGETRDEVRVTREEVSARLTNLEAVSASQLAQLKVGHTELVELLRLVHDSAQLRRARLHELRASNAYDTPYSEPDPLVSVVIPTYDNYGLLRERSIPSVLAQTHQNFEVVVVGDAAPDEARTIVESFGDPRIKFFNRLYRGPYPEDPSVRWLVAGVPPYNEAVRRAKGMWIAPLDDDDAFRPHHLKRMLTRLREERLELCYGRLRAHHPNGQVRTLGRFPPAHAAFSLQSAVYHAGLAEIFELELSDAAFGLPYDWAVCLRMLEADVRIGMVEEETVDIYPSRWWTPRWEEHFPGPEQSQPEWTYVPEGFECDHNGPRRGWDAPEVARAYSEKWPSFLKALEGTDPLGVSHEVPAGEPIDRYEPLAQNSVLAYAYALARAANGARTVSVLDWGGALGHFYVLARRLFPELELDYHCRELPAVCAEGGKLVPEVTFHDTDECLERTYDLVLASNSLQYREDWQRLLRELASSSASWLFLTKVPVVRQHTSFVMLQRAHAYGYDTEYLGWVFNRDELLDAADGVGLELERELALLHPFSVHAAPEAFTQSGFLFRAGGPRR